MVTYFKIQNLGFWISQLKSMNLQHKCPVDIWGQSHNTMQKQSRAYSMCEIFHWSSEMA